MVEGASDSLTGKELRVMVLSLEGASFFKFDPASKQLDQDTSLPEFVSATLCKFSPMGTFAAISDDQAVHMISMKAQGIIFSIKQQNVSAMRFSP